VLVLILANVGTIQNTGGRDTQTMPTLLPSFSSHLLCLPFAPQCIHSQNLAPYWDKLSDEWRDNAAVLIAEVDCTTQSVLCEANGVHAYPTIKYGDPSALAVYEGNRSDITQFIQDLMSPVAQAASDIADEDRLNLRSVKAAEIS
jgi:thiol-disulfide isomerase/thioredoxin